jgi:hypothetical protein
MHSEDDQLHRHSGLRWSDDELRREMATAVANLPSSPAPVEMVVRGGRARNRRRAGVIGSAGAVVAAGSVAVAMGYPLQRSTVEAPGVTRPPTSAATRSGAVRPAPPPPPLSAAERDRLARRCAADLERTGSFIPILAVRTVAGPAALVRIGQDSLACWGYGDAAVMGGPGSKIAVTSADAAHPVRTVDVGAVWDGEVWSAVLRVAPNIAAATVAVNGGKPYGVAIANGLAVAACRSKTPRTPATSDRAGSKPRDLTAADPVVRLTAYNASGGIVWQSTSSSGIFGWVSPTHPNH